MASTVLTIVGIIAGALLLLSLAVPLLKIPVSKAIIAQANDLDSGYFVPLPPPGKFSFVMVNDNKLERILENVTSWKLIQCPDGEYRYARSNSQRNTQSVIEDDEIEWFKSLGVTWVGLYAKLKKFPNWKWTEFRQKTDQDGNALPGYDIAAKTKDVYEFFFQVNPAIEIKGMELTGNITVAGKVLLTVWHLGPKKAFLEVPHYDDTLVGIVQAAIRGWSTGKSFEELKTETEKATHDSPFARMLRELNGIDLDDDGDPDYSTVQQGGLFQIMEVVIWDAVWQDLIPEGPAAEALIQKEINRREGEAAVEKQKQEQARIMIEAQTAVDKAIKDRERVLAETQTLVEKQEMLAKSRRDFVETTIVKPIRDGGPAVAEVLIAELMSSEKSRVSTWVKGNSPVALIPEDKK